MFLKRKPRVKFVDKFTPKEIRRAIQYFQVELLNDNYGQVVVDEKLKSLSDEDFIKALYYILLFRDPDPEGLKANVKFLQSWWVTRGIMIYKFKRSQEYKIKQDIPVEVLDKSIVDWHLPTGHEMTLLNMFKKKHEGVFIDVGAHVGTWSIHLAPYFERVIAFEPHPGAFNALKKNLQKNKIQNVLLEPFALWDDGPITKKMTLYATPSHSTLLETHPLEHKIKGNRLSEIEVPVLPLDLYLKNKSEKISLIKIDVEGGEVNVLKGGINTIKRQKPILVIEIHAEENIATIKKLLSKIYKEFREVKYNKHEYQYLIYM